MTYETCRRQTATFKGLFLPPEPRYNKNDFYFWSLPHLWLIRRRVCACAGVCACAHSVILGGFGCKHWWTHLQVVTGHQEDASIDALPPGLGPCWVIFGGELAQLEGRGHCFGQTHRGADAHTLPLRAVGRCGTLNPCVVVDLKEERISFVLFP